MDIDISAEAEQAASDVAQQYNRHNFKDSLEYLHRECGIPITRIADAVGVPRRYIYRWADGDHAPLNPFPMAVVIRWAKRKKEERQPDTSPALAA